MTRDDPRGAFLVPDFLIYVLAFGAVKFLKIIRAAWRQPHIWRPSLCQPLVDPPRGTSVHRTKLIKTDLTGGPEAAVSLMLHGGERDAV